MKRKRYIRKILLIILLIILIIFCLYLLINIVKKKNKSLDKEVKTEKISESKTIETSNTNEKKYHILTEYEGYSVIAKLEIPVINLETYVLSEFSEEALQISVTKFYGGNPNEPGNFCISGHNYVLKNMFHNLKDLNINDEIFLTDEVYGKIKYNIYDIVTVYPKQTAVLSQETDGKTELTLITCTRDSKKRIIIKAQKDVNS